MAIYALGDVEPTIDPGAYVHPDAVLIGDVVLGPEASVWPSAVLRADNARITVGAGTSIQDGTVIHVSSHFSGTVVGDRVTVGHGVILHACTVEDDCIIGMGSIILDGARIRRHCIVGAGALVTPGTDIPEGSLVMGAPARVKRPITDDERARIAVSADNYVELTRRYLAGES